jgi:hypothetical protein
VIYPGETIDVNVVLVEAAKKDLQQSIRKSGIDFTSTKINDRLDIEWCQVSPEWTNQLSGDKFADFEVVLKMWSAASAQRWISFKYSIGVKFYEEIKEDKLDDIFCTEAFDVQPFLDDSHDAIPKMISVASSGAESSKSSSSPHSALLERLRQTCENLAADKNLLVTQLEQSEQEIAKFKKQARRVNFERMQVESVDKALRCPKCNGNFSSNPSSQRVPMSSQSCEHSICRKCLPRHPTLLLAVVTCDPTLGGCSRIDYSCPVCRKPKAFDKPNVNQGLCTVLKTLKK